MLASISSDLLNGSSKKGRGKAVREAGVFFLQLICLGRSQHQARPRIIIYLTNLIHLSADMIHPKTRGGFWHLSEINILDIFCDKLLWHMPSFQAVVLLIWIYSWNVQMHCTPLHSPNDTQSWAWPTLYLQNLACIELTVSIYMGSSNSILGCGQRAECSAVVFLQAFRSPHTLLLIRSRPRDQKWVKSLFML